MKKILIPLMLFCAASLYSQGADYPSIMNNGTIFLNIGAGYGSSIETDMKIPPLTVSMDFTIPIAGFPMSFGLIGGYLSESGPLDADIDYLLVAGRLAYHLGFGLPRLDTYVNLTVGGIIGFVSGESDVSIWLGLGAGARYFFLPNVGAFVELGFDKVQNVCAGFSFRI